jgi:hypothetical protein
MAQDQEKTEKEFDISKEKFSFMPGSSLTQIERAQNRAPTKEPECYPSPTSPAYDPSKPTTKVSLVTDVFAERCTRHVYASGRDKIPTIYLPKSWMMAWGIDWINKKNAHDIIRLEMSADREEIRIKRVPNPDGMKKPVDYELFAADSDEEAQMLEVESERTK